jgi:hypothetical protein
MVAPLVPKQTRILVFVMLSLPAVSPAGARRANEQTADN